MTEILLVEISTNLPDFGPRSFITPAPKFVSDFGELETGTGKVVTLKLVK